MMIRSEILGFFLWKSGPELSFEVFGFVRRVVAAGTTIFDRPNRSVRARLRVPGMRTADWEQNNPYLWVVLSIPSVPSIWKHF